jgi:hypothetical protein
MKTGVTTGRRDAGPQPFMPVRPRAGLLQGECACGGPAGASGECESCRAGKLQPARERGATAPQIIPAIVHQVLRSPGQPLDEATRSAMEARFGHDFAKARIHTGPRAAESAAAVNALAYTVGQSIVFAAGRYAPNTEAGRRLLAHELAHTVQQSFGGSARQVPSRISDPDEPAEREADAAAAHAVAATSAPIRTGAAGSLSRLSYSPLFHDSAQTAEGGEAQRTEEEPSAAMSGAVSRSIDTLLRAPDDMPGQRGMDAGSNPPFGETSRGGTLPYRQVTDLADCIRIMGEENADECRHQILGTPRPVKFCLPDSDPTWADFAGKPPRSGFAADTHWTFDTTVTDWGIHIVRAIFNGSKSWVKPEPANPTDRTKTQCGRLVRQCTTAVATPNTTWSLGAQTGCPATPRWNTSLVATNAGECDRVIGAECDRVSVLDSARLLTHEQYHFRLPCAVANKASAAVAANPRLTPERARDLASALASRPSAQYDSETGHGCVAATQARCQTNINNGLPTARIP